MKTKVCIAVALTLLVSNLATAKGQNHGTEKENKKFQNNVMSCAPRSPSKASAKHFNRIEAIFGTDTKKPTLGLLGLLN